MLKCPYCKSKNSKRIEAIISQGSKEIDLGTLVGLGGFGGSGSSGMKLGVLGGKASTKGKIQSTLSKRLNSMRPKKPGCIISYFLTGMMLILVIYGIASETAKSDEMIPTIIFLALFSWWSYSIYKRRKSHPEKLDKFKRTWYCFDCDKLSLTRK